MADEPRNNQMACELVFEIDAENAFINPLRVSTECERSVVSEQRANATLRNGRRCNLRRVWISERIHLPLSAFFLGSTYVLATIFAALSAIQTVQSTERDSKILQYDERLFSSLHGYLAASLNGAQLVLLVANFIVGHVIVYHFKSGGPKRPKEVFYLVSFVLFVAISCVILFFAKIPDEAFRHVDLPNKDSNYNGCVLFKQGNPWYSVNPSLYTKMKFACPSLVDENVFHKINPGLLNNGAVTTIEGMVGYASTIIPFMKNEKNYAKSKDIAGRLVCLSMFPPCDVSCRAIQPCEIFTAAWYQRNHTEREGIISSELKKGSMAANMEYILDVVQNEDQRRFLGAFTEIFEEVTLSRVQQEWENEPAITNNISQCIPRNYTFVQAGTCDPSSPKNNQGTKAKKSSIVLNPEFLLMKNIRAYLVIATFCTLTVANFVISWKGNLWYIHGYKRRGKKQTFHLTVLRCFGYILVLSVCFLTAYGGSLLVTQSFVRKENETENLVIAMHYFFTSCLISCSFSYFLVNENRFRRKRPRKQNEDNNVFDKIRSCIAEIAKNANKNRYFIFLKKCADPKQPEFVYRVVLLEALEVSLQLGAMIYPQVLNARMVVVMVAVIATNMLATTCLLSCMTLSRKRTAALLVVELMSDGFFMVYGIVRLRANLELGYIGHLALLKPIVTFVFDCHDLLVVIDFHAYGQGSLKKLLTIMASEDDQKSSKLFKQNCSFYCRRLVAVFLLAGIFSVLGICASNFVNIEFTCVEEVGKVAYCANERHYFDVEWGILGKPSCNFQSIKELSCSSFGIVDIPKTAGRKMKNLEVLDLSRNPQLVLLPSSFAAIATLRTVDVSDTGVKNFPFAIANATNIRNIIVENAPCEKEIDWSGSTLQDMPTQASAFYKTFAPTLVRLDVSNNMFQDMERWLPSVCLLSRLEFLNASGSGLTKVTVSLRDISFNLFEALNNLQTLDVSNNQIQNIQITQSAVDNSIEFVDLRRNPLVKIQLKEQFKNAREIRLYLSNLHLPPHSLRTLQFLGCTFDHVTNILPWPSAFDRLTVFYGSASVIEDLGSEKSGLAIFKPLQHLEILEADACRTQGSIGELAGLSNLRLLSVMRNKVGGDIDEIFRLTKLTELRIDTNEVTIKRWDHISKLSRLEIFMAGRNRLNGSLPSSISALTNLTKLVLDTNKISGEIPRTLGRLSKLDWLDIDSNAIEGHLSPVSSLTRLGGLSCAHNRLRGEVRALAPLLNLRRVMIAHNNLSGSLYPWIGNLTHLTRFESVGNSFVDEWIGRT
jgi:Leucine-rich repeat (LRR) protein